MLLFCIILSEDAVRNVEQLKKNNSWRSLNWFTNLDSQINCFSKGRCMPQKFHIKKRRVLAWCLPTLAVLGEKTAQCNLIKPGIIEVLETKVRPSTPTVFVLIIGAPSSYILPSPVALFTLSPSYIYGNFSFFWVSNSPEVVWNLSFQSIILLPRWKVSIYNSLFYLSQTRNSWPAISSISPGCCWKVSQNVWVRYGEWKSNSKTPGQVEARSIYNSI